MWLHFLGWAACTTILATCQAHKNPHTRPMRAGISINGRTACAGVYLTGGASSCKRRSLSSSTERRACGSRESLHSHEQPSCCRLRPGMADGAELRHVPVVGSPSTLRCDFRVADSRTREDGRHGGDEATRARATQSWACFPCHHNCIVSSMVVHARLFRTCPAERCVQGSGVSTRMCSRASCMMALPGTDWLSRATTPTTHHGCRRTPQASWRRAQGRPLQSFLRE
jgi:hypothetical protein